MILAHFKKPGKTITYHREFKQVDYVIDRTELYKTLPDFLRLNPQYADKKSNIEHFISRKKVNFEDDWVIVEKKKIQRGVEKFLCVGCPISAECMDLGYCPKAAGDKFIVLK